MSLLHKVKIFGEESIIYVNLERERDRERERQRERDREREREGGREGGKERQLNT